MTDVLRNLPVPEQHLAGIAASLALRRRWRAPLPGSPTVHRIAGCSLLASGCALNGWALSERRRHSAGTFNLERPDSLVTTGPYAVSRHPMYVGWWLIHLGAGVFGGSAWVMATLPAAVLLGHPGALAEEHELADAFGQDFRKYAEQVPRYVPAAPGHLVLTGHSRAPVRPEGGPDRSGIQSEQVRGIPGDPSTGTLTA